jgi:uncharacterized protein (DUF983 family)
MDTPKTPKTPRAPAALLLAGGIAVVLAVTVAKRFALALWVIAVIVFLAALVVVLRGLRRPRR